MRAVLRLIVLGVGLTAATAAVGQAPNSPERVEWRLAGLTGVTVRVRLSEASKRCDLQEGPLTSAVLLPIRAYTKLADNDQSELEISVSSAESDQGWCVHALTAQLTTPILVRLPYQAEETQRRVLLWSHYVVAAAQVREPSYVADTAEAIGKQFAMAWQESNATPVTGKIVEDPFKKAMQGR
ncbi:MAG: hypothetical protein K8F92_14800 [Hyphomicrobium sp.]|uniref:hypothetical protein n=1 Tax=Hyphomicrobium sp. TaxID=82 RepID=UPI0013279436|nr:hypothetical protein [Hyphomicrobium sp.]KAB2942947.1 MAG: hypothetical protein F9K20_05660 [Hyphomicrobium sp.]MBZ0210901.1 hypothetical protein [Hyphomicrobium sp.]